jgi:hypothetical protein
MMQLRGIIGLPLVATLGGCALSQATPKIALDYNRDFADSRNEMLLLNVLRAAAREPLQFSTMGTVQGTVGNGSSLELPFTNLIAGGANAISPKLSFSDAINPSVTFTPLASKEFATGVLSPMRTDTIQLFLHNGWDPEFLLPLIVGGVVCPDRQLLLNSGEYLDDAGQPKPLHVAFRKFFKDSAPSFSIRTVPADATAERIYVVTDKEALEALKDGLGTGYVFEAVKPSPGGGKQLVVKPSPQTSVSGFAIGELCKVAPAAGSRGFAPLTADAISTIKGAYEIRESGPKSSSSSPGRIIFRSVGSIIQYLGEAHRVRYLAGRNAASNLDYFNRENEAQTLFKIDWGLRQGAKAVQTRFQGTEFYIPRMWLGQKETSDRTLKTLSFLDQLIALQTSESSIRGAQPVISVN